MGGDRTPAPYGGVPIPPHGGVPAPMGVSRTPPPTRTPKNRKKSRCNTHVLMGGVFWRLGKAYEQVSALICDNYARRILRAAAIWGGLFCSQGAK